MNLPLWKLQWIASDKSTESMRPKGTESGVCVCVCVCVHTGTFFWFTWVLFSYCCCNNLPCTLWLWTTQVDYHTVLEAKSIILGLTGLKSRCWQSCAASGSSGGGSVSLLSSASRSYSHILVHGPLPFSKPACQIESFLYYSASGSSTSFFHLKISLLLLWTLQIIQDLLPILSQLVSNLNSIHKLNCLLSCSLT